MIADPAAAQDSITGLAARIESWIALGQPGIVWTRYVSDLSRNEVLDKLSAGHDLPRLVFAPPSPEDAAVWLEERLTEFAHLSPPPAVVAVLFPFAPPDDEGNALWASFRNLNLRRERLARFPFVQLWWISSAISARAELEASDLVSWFKLRLWLNEIPLTVAVNEVARLRMLASEWPELGSELAGGVMNLGNRLGEVGRHEEALKAAEESVRLGRDWVCSHPEDISTLADSLNNLGVRYSRLGSYGKALSASEVAVATYRQLAAARPKAFLADLAMSLNNRGIILRELGRLDDALQATEEAVTIYRQLADARPADFLPDLGMSVDNLGNIRSELGLREEALLATEESVTIRRQLATARPDAFLTDLASSLNNLGIRYSWLGRAEEALSASEEAVAAYRQLAAARPKALLPDLAMSLGTYGSSLASLDRASEAVRSFHEAIQMLKDPFLRHPPAYRRLMNALVSSYLSTSQASDLEVDTALLADIKPHLQPSPFDNPTAQTLP